MTLFVTKFKFIGGAWIENAKRLRIISALISDSSLNITDIEIEVRGNALASLLT